MSATSLETRGTPLVPSERFGSQYAVYSWRNVEVLVWLSPATQPGVDRLHLYIPRRLKELGTKFSCIHYMMMGTKMPNAEGRAALSQLGTRWSEQVGPMACIIEQDGFLGSAVRAMATGIILMTSQRLTLRIAATAAEAAAWLPGPHRTATGVAIDSSALLDFLMKVRDTHPATPSIRPVASV